MAIKIEHQPPAAVIGGAAFIGGRGQYNKWLREQQLREAALMQQDIQQQRAINAAQQSQAFAARNNAMQAEADRAFRMHLAGAELAIGDRDFARRRDLAAADLAKRRGFEVEDRDFAAKLAKERDAGIAARMAADDARRAEEAARAADEMSIRGAEDDRRRFITEMYDTGAWKLDEASMKRLAELRSSRTGVLTDKRWTPAKRAEKLRELEGEFWNIMENPSPPLPGETPPPLEKQIADETKWLRGEDGVMRQYQKIKRAGATMWDVIAEEEKLAPKDQPGAKKLEEWKKFYTANQENADGEQQDLPTIRRKFKEYWDGIESGPDEVPPLEEGKLSQAPLVAAALPRVRTEAELGTLKLLPGQQFIGPDGKKWESMGDWVRPLDEEPSPQPAMQMPPPPSLKTGRENMPPGPPPPVIPKTAQGEQILRAMLAASPDGVVYIDAETGKRMFIKGPTQ